MNILVIIPAYNEEENILNVIADLKTNFSEADILVINDCSKDNTENLLIENNINYLNTPFNLGYSGVVQTGFKYAVKNDYDYVAQFDGDGQHIASELKKMYYEIKQNNFDLVVGSRFLKETDYNHSFFRSIGTNLFRRLIKISCGQNITDPTSGLQVLNKKIYNEYSKIYNYPEYPDANLLIRIIKKGYKVREIPVNMRERIAGVSMHAGIWKPIKYMIKMFYSIFITNIIVKNDNIKGKVD